MFRLHSYTENSNRFKIPQVSLYKINSGTTGVTEQYPPNSLESFENIDDEKKNCDNENCDLQIKTTTFWLF